MKRLIIKTLLFLVPVLLVIVAWELLMYHFPHIFKYKRDVVMKKCFTETEMIVLGSSHAYFGVNTDLIPKAGNLAYASQYLSQDRWILEKILSQPNKLKYVIISVSLFSLFDSTSANNASLEKLYVRYWGYPAARLTDHLFIMDDVNAQIKHLLKKGKKLRKKGLCAALDVTPSGYGTECLVSRNYSRFKSLGRAAARRHAIKDLNKNKNFDHLMAMIKLCQKHNIKVLLFIPPAHITYRTHIVRKQERRMRELLAQARAESNVLFLDLLRSKKFGNNDFFDPDHMNARGAKKLTLMLYNFCKKDSAPGKL